MGFEDSLQKGIFSGSRDRTFIDKLLGRRDAEDLRKLIKKPKLTRADLLEILYLLTSTESKLLNYSEWDRYIILKYFVWLREFTKVAELLYDYRENIEEREIQLSKEAERMLENNQRLIEHNAKFLIDLYLNIARTSLSVGATGFLEILNNKYEFHYPSSSAHSGGQESKGAWGLGKK